MLLSFKYSINYGEKYVNILNIAYKDGIYIYIYIYDTKYIIIEKNIDTSANI